VRSRSTPLTCQRVPKFCYPSPLCEGTMRVMRTSGLVFVATAILGFSACRCNKSPGPQTTPSATSAVVASQPIAAAEVSSAPTPTTNGTSGAGAPAPAALVAVEPLDFVPAKGSKMKPLTLKRDGLLVRATKDAAPNGKAGAPSVSAEKVVAKFVGDNLSDDDGSPIAAFAPMGAITVAGAKSSTFKFNDKDELEGPGGLKISVADDGTPSIVLKAKAPPEKLTGKFVNFDPRARRAAVVMLALHELKQAAKAAQPPKVASGEPKKDKKGKKGKKNKKNKKNKKKD